MLRCGSGQSEENRLDQKRYKELASKPEAKGVLTTKVENANM